MAAPTMCTLKSHLFISICIIYSSLFTQHFMDKYLSVLKKESLQIFNLQAYDDYLSYRLKHF